MKRHISINAYASCLTLSMHSLMMQVPMAHTRECITPAGRKLRIEGPAGGAVLAALALALSPVSLQPSTEPTTTHQNYASTPGKHNDMLSLPPLQSQPTPGLQSLPPTSHSAPPLSLCPCSLVPTPPLPNLCPALHGIEGVRKDALSCPMPQPLPSPALLCPTWHRRNVLG